MALTITILFSTPIKGNTISKVGTKITPPPIPKSPAKSPVIKPIANNSIIIRTSILNT